jgi:hypothetical protein
LAADNPAALDLLTALAWCAPQPVPLSLFTEHPDELPERLRHAVTDPLELSRCTRLLRRRGMATVAPHSMQLHRVPAALLRARTRTDPEAWGALVIRLLSVAVPGEVWSNPAGWPQWQILLPHVLAAVAPDRHIDEAVAGDVAWLLHRAATYRRSRGDLRPALLLRRRAYALRRDRLGVDHPDTLAAANSLAADLRALGQHEQARDLDQDTLTRYRRSLGDDHASTLVSANGLAADFRALGQHEQARALDEDNFLRCRRILGEDHPSTLVSANGLAADLRNLGQHEQARDLDQDTLTRKRRTLGDNHPSTLASANGLAADLRNLGQHEQARDLDQDTLTRSRRILGEDHPSTLISATSLAADLRALGQHEQARDLDQDTLTRKRRTLGEDHPETRRAEANLAEACRQLPGLAGQSDS